MNNTSSELNNTVEGIKSKLDEAEDRISELEAKSKKTSRKSKKRKKGSKRMKRVKGKCRDKMKWNNIHIIQITEGEVEQGIENLFEKIMQENFPHLMTEMVPLKRNPKGPTSRHIIIKMAKFKDKERILKAEKDKQ